MKKFIIFVVIAIALLGVVFIAIEMNKSTNVNTEIFNTDIENTETLNPELESTQIENTETLSADALYFIENPAVKLSNLTGHITTISIGNNDYSFVLGFSEYPLIIRKDFHKGGSFSENSDGGKFAVANELGGERVLYYSDGGEIKVVDEPDIIDCELFNNGESIVWTCGDIDSGNASLKIMRDGKITVLSENVVYANSRSTIVHGFLAFPEDDAVIWHEDFKREDDTYKTYLYKDGEIGLLGENIGILGDNIGISGGITGVFSKSAGTERIYYRQNGNLYVQNGFDNENRVLIAEYNDDEKFSDPDVWNSDYTQFISTVYNSDGSASSYYYEEGKEPVFLIDREVSAKKPENIDETDDLSEYYYYSQNKDYSIDVYRLDKTRKLDFVKTLSSIRNFKTFYGTKNFIYSDDEYNYLYDASSGESTVLKQREGYYTVFTALPDLSEMYAGELMDGHSMIFNAFYAINPSGEMELIHDYVCDYTVDGDTLYYMTDDELYMRKNGENKLLTKLDVWGSELDIDENGYFIINVHTAPEDTGIYSTHDYKSNYYISSDGENFVCVEEYAE